MALTYGHPIQHNSTVSANQFLDTSYAGTPLCFMDVDWGRYLTEVYKNDTPANRWQFEDDLKQSLPRENFAEKRVSDVLATLYEQSKIPATDEMVTWAFWTFAECFDNPYLDEIKEALLWVLDEERPDVPAQEKKSSLPWDGAVWGLKKFFGWSTNNVEERVKERLAEEEDYSDCSM